MILSDSCWLKQYQHGCAGYENKGSECRAGTVFCPKLFKLEMLYNFSMLPKEKWAPVTLYTKAAHVDYNQFVQLREINKNITQFVNNGDNLFIASKNCGNGKTSWAIKLMQSYMNTNWTRLPSDKPATLFIHVPRFFIELKNNISIKSAYIEQINSRVLEADLVVWDEIAVKNLTEFEHEHLLTLINARMDSGKANIYTSNVTGINDVNRGYNPLLEALGNRLYSRVFCASIPIEFSGSDNRGTNIKEMLK